MSDIQHKGKCAALEDQSANATQPWNNCVTVAKPLTGHQVLINNIWKFECLQPILHPLLI